MSTPKPAAEQPWWPSPKARESIASGLSDSAAELTTAAMARIAEQHVWFSGLEAEHRSWVTVVARSGIDGFINWFGSGGQGDPGALFAAAPRALTRRVTLNQTVDLVLTTIETVEGRIADLPEAEQLPLRIGILRYSREVAFAAARVYARAAEIRGAWDARLEAMVVDAIVRGDADESVVSRASTLGWASPSPGVVVVIGSAPEDPGSAVETIRASAAGLGMDLLAAPQGDRLVLVIGTGCQTVDELVPQVMTFAEEFGEGQVVVGPIVSSLMDAARSARAAMSGLRAVRAWPESPRTIAAERLLPERALAGDGHARRALATELFQPLVAAGGDLVPTLTAYFGNAGSIEATARELFVHANTVRYRLRRVAEVTGYSPTDARDAYALRLSLTLGRLLT
ncbi:MAG: helix-turn-helix domain-containing protein [Propionicimonas sp.]